MSERVEKLRAYVADFEACQRRHASFGAADTEPDGVFQHAIVRQLERLGQRENRAVDIPSTVREWQLYDMNGAGNVARELGSKARRVNAEIRAIVTKHGAQGWRDVCKWAEGYCWRCAVVWISD